MSDLLWERGYSATSPREVRERSGVGQGSMYHHFPSKRDLGIAAIKHNCDALLPPTRDVLLGSESPMERLTAYLSREHEPLLGCKVGRLTQDPEVANDSEMLAPINEAFAQVHSMLVKVIGEAVEHKEIPDHLDPDRLADLLMVTIQGGYVLAIAAQDRGPFDRARLAALDLLNAHL